MKHEASYLVLAKKHKFVKLKFSDKYVIMFGHLSILECFVGNLELGEVTGHQAESLSDRARKSCLLTKPPSLIN